MTSSPERKAASLAAVRLFDGVDPSGMAKIAAVAIEVEFPAGQVIARQGDIGSGLFVIITGRVRVTRDGRQIGELGPGDLFGELSVLDGRPRTAQVIAEEATTCLALSTWEFESVVREQPGVALAILRGLAARLRELTEADRH
jgi:CRP/FNR family cyclic AMP-dependent transcriptional regulator